MIRTWRSLFPLELLVSGKNNTQGINALNALIRFAIDVCDKSIVLILMGIKPSLDLLLEFLKVLFCHTLIQREFDYS